MNILMLSEANSVTANYVRDFLGVENLSVGYVAASTDVSRKKFAAAKEFYVEAGNQELEYFDLDEEFSDSTLSELKKMNVLHLGQGSTAHFNRLLKKCNFRRFLGDYLYIGGKVIGEGAGAVVLCPEISICRELVEPVPVSEVSALNFVSFEIFPRYLAECNLDLRLRTLSSQRGGRTIYGIPANSAIELGKNEFRVRGTILKFHAWDAELLHESEQDAMPLPRAPVLENTNTMTSHSSVMAYEELDDGSPCELADLVFQEIPAMQDSSFHQEPVL